MYGSEKVKYEGSNPAGIKSQDGVSLAHHMEIYCLFPMTKR